LGTGGEKVRSVERINLKKILDSMKSPVKGGEGVTELLKKKRGTFLTKPRGILTPLSGWGQQKKKKKKNSTFRGKVTRTIPLPVNEGWHEKTRSSFLCRQKKDRKRRS